MQALLRVSGRRVRAYIKDIREQFAPLPDPPDYVPPWGELSRDRVSPGKLRDAWGAAWGEYRATWTNWRGTQDTSSPPEDPDGVTLQESLQAAQGVGQHVVTNLKDLSPEARSRLQGFASERLEVAKECLQAFLEGYREGKAAEVDRELRDLGADAAKALRDDTPPNSVHK